MRQVLDGRRAVFSAANPGCAGAIGYFGFRELPAPLAALYLSGRERLKKNATLAAAFYQEVQAPPALEEYLVFQRLDTVDDHMDVKVINLWVSAVAFSRLHTLANYDRSSNDNVIIPFAAGCQSIWTLPFKESMAAEPRAVAGSLDPTVRPFLPPEAISFSLPAGRFLEMCRNIPGSFISR